MQRKISSKFSMEKKQNKPNFAQYIKYALLFLQKKSLINLKFFNPTGTNFL